MAFIEGKDEVSFSNEHVDYLDETKFCNPFVANKLFDTLINRVETKYDDEDSLNTISISHIKATDSVINSFEKYFTDYDFTVEHCPHWEKYKKVTVDCKSSLEEALDLVKLLCFYCSIADERVYTQDSLNEKYIKLIEKCDAPYFIRYLFKTRLLRNSEKGFRKYEDLFNKSRTHQYKFVAKNNWESRFDYVVDNIGSPTTIVDIGCGEGRYMTRLAKKCESYICHDQDADVLKVCERKAKQNKLDNVLTMDKFPDKLDADATVICSEVVEHLDPQDYKGFIHEILSLGAGRVIFTTPNRDFNQFYGIDSRHEDHPEEMNATEFYSLVNDCIFSCPIPYLSFVMSGVGDTVNNIATTTGITLIKK